MIGGKERFVLDSFAVLAYLQGEAGAKLVRSILERAGMGEAEAAISLINLGEVLYIIERRKNLEVAQGTLAAIDGLPPSQPAGTRALTLRAAHYKANYKMSYADCFAAALAAELEASVVTGDPEFRAVENQVAVTWLE